MSARSKGSLAAALVSAPLVAVLIAALLVWTPPASLADGAKGSTVVASRVSQREVAAYCPTRMTVADEDKVGDDQFKASEGDLTARVTAAAFGSIGSASLTPLGDGRRIMVTDPDPPGRYGCGLSAARYRPRNHPAAGGLQSVIQSHSDQS